MRAAIALALGFLFGGVLAGCDAETPGGGDGGGAPVGSVSSTTASSSSGSWDPQWPTCDYSLEASPGWDITGDVAIQEEEGAPLNMTVKFTDGWPVKAFYAMFAAANGHVAVPAQQPTFALERGADMLGEGAVSIQTVADYEIDPTSIKIDLSAAPEVSGPGRKYTARFIGEGGAGAKMGLKFKDCFCYYGAR